MIYEYNRSVVQRLRWGLLAVLMTPLLASASQISEFQGDSLTMLYRMVCAHPERYRYSELALLVSQQAYPKLTREKIMKVEADLDKHAQRLAKQLRGLTSYERKIIELNKYIHKVMAMRSNSNDSINPKYYFLHRTLRARCGSCLGMCLLYLSLAERVNLPIVPVRAPGHIYVRFQNPRLTYDIETTNGGLRFDALAYSRSKGFNVVEARKLGHFVTMKKTDLLADLLVTLVFFSLKDKVPRPLTGRRAVHAANLAIKLSPEFYTNWEIYADALLAAGDARNALLALEQAQRRAPNLGNHKGRKYWQDKMQLFRLEVRLAEVDQARVSRAPSKSGTSHD